MGMLSRWFGPPTRETFARRMIDAVRANGEAREPTFDAAQFRLTYGAGGTNALYLENAYAAYCRAGRAGRPGVLRQFASVVGLGEDPEEPFEAVKGQLLPRVRERAYYAEFELRQRIEAAGKPVTAPALYQPWAGGALTVEVVRDLPTAIASVHPGQYSRWGVPFEAALAAARENLWRLSNADFERVRPGLFVSPWHDAHDASRMFLHDLIWQLPVRGLHVAAVPNRDVLIVTGSEDEANLAAMATLAGEVLDQPRAMTGTVFRLDGKAWEPFLPAAPSPAHEPLRALAGKQLSRDYAQQQALLDALHKAAGADVFVSTPLTVRSAGGRPFTIAVWVADVADAMLPAADWVAFGEAAGAAGPRKVFARWDAVVRVAGHRMEPVPELYPPRWRVRSFPTADELAEMGATEEPPT